MKQILTVILVLLALGLMSTISTVTTSANRTPGTVTSLSPTILNGTADTLVWVIENVLGTTLLGHFYATGDSTGITLDIKGSNFKGSDGRWIDIATYSFAGAAADTTYFSAASTATYNTYRFQLTAGDTTTVDARVKIN